MRPEPSTQEPSRTESKLAKDALAINLGVFQAVLVTYLALLLVESLVPGYVTKHLNLDGILAVVVVSGIVATLTAKETGPESAEKRLRMRDFILVALLAVASWLILWYQLRKLGWIQFPISILGGLLVGLASLTVLLPEKNEVAPGSTPPRPAPSKPAAEPSSPAAPATFEHRCPRCGLRAALPTRLAGRLVRCPRCGQVSRTNGLEPKVPTGPTALAGRKAKRPMPRKKRPPPRRRRA